MAPTHDEFNEKVTEFLGDVALAVSCFPDQGWSVEAELADEDSDRLRAVVDAKVDLRAPQAEFDDTLAQFSANYKLCVDSYGDHLAVEHSTFVLKATLDRTPIIRWDYDRDAKGKPSSHVQMTAHRGALSHLLSRLNHETPHSIESLHMPMGGDRFRPCLEDIIEFLIRDAASGAAKTGERSCVTVVRNGGAYKPARWSATLPQRLRINLRRWATQ